MSMCIYIVTNLVCSDVVKEYKMAMINYSINKLHQKISNHIDILKDNAYVIM